MIQPSDVNKYHFGYNRIYIPVFVTSFKPVYRVHFDFYTTLTLRTILFYFIIIIFF